MVNVEVFLDILCPWCFVGRRRLKSAIEQFEGQVNVNYRAFELDANAPIHKGMKIDELLAKKYRVSIDQAREMNGRLSTIGDQEGIAFDFSEMKSTNSFDALSMMKFLQSKGFADQYLDRVMNGYFESGALISDRNYLIDLATLFVEDDESFSSDDIFGEENFGAEVRNDEAYANELGVTGVPFYLFESKYVISGAQESATFLSALRKVAELKAGTSSN
ncbi:MAG: DsbA family oxidoreductase [Actinomycetota bacterium]|nr:DsbA family oxidoreductase [Actinomycetota bacterium]